jgi:hypothetical protein
MRFDYRAADREPHSHAEGFARYERLEYGVSHLGGDPGSGIGHGGPDGLFAAPTPHFASTFRVSAIRVPTYSVVLTSRAKSPVYVGRCP